MSELLRATIAVLLIPTVAYYYAKGDIAKAQFWAIMLIYNSVA